MANVYENSYMIVGIFLLLGILLPVVALTLGKLLRHINQVQQRKRRTKAELNPIMMQMFVFMLVIIFLHYCLSFLMWKLYFYIRGLSHMTSLVCSRLLKC